MGTLPDFLPGYLSIEDAQNRQKFQDKWDNKMPVTAGCSALETIDQARKGKVKGMFIMGENPAVSFPQPSRVKEALASLGFLVVTDMFLTETAQMASVVLPAASFAEKEGTFTNFEGRVQGLHKAIEPVGQSLPDGEILWRLAEAMNSPMPYGSYRDITDEIEEMVTFYHHPSPGGPERGEAELGDIRESRPGTQRLYKGLFPSGFGRFSPVDYVPLPAIDGYPYTLIAGSVRYGFGSGGRSSRSARLSRFNGDGYLDINDTDAKKLGIGNGDTVKIISPHGELSKPARIIATLPRGLVFTPLASPGGNVNELFSAALDKQSKAPSVKSCAVRLERV
jgi:predicted molibdopterin-dependent oxidoreductase YjgC